MFETIMKSDLILDNEFSKMFNNNKHTSFEIAHFMFKVSFNCWCTFYPNK